MSLTKQTTVDQITIMDDGVVHYREATKIFDDDAEISKSYHRATLLPGQDLSSVPQKVAAICSAAWTPEVVSDFEQAMNSAKAAP